MTKAVYQKSFWGNLAKHVEAAVAWWNQREGDGGKRYRQKFRTNSELMGFVLEHKDAEEEDERRYGPGR